MRLGLRICIDVGGTFTDLISVDEKGEWFATKSSSTPPDFDEGVIDVLKLCSEHYEVSIDELLSKSISLIYNGTTISTNAILQNRAAKTGFLTTAGFKHILLMREGGKTEPFKWDIDYPEPYVPLYLTMPIRERMNYAGEEVIPLNEDDVRKAIRQLKEWNVEAVGVCLLWSIANPAHEKRIGEIIKEEWPEAYVSLSHEVNPVIREYRRASSTVIDASLKPVMSRYISRLEKFLTENGFVGDFYLVTSSGGVATAEDVSKRPIYTVNSGPTTTPAGGLLIAEQEKGINDVLVIDMGGTSFDVGVVRDGSIMSSKESWIAEEYTSHMLGVEKVDIRSVGAGGGSVAWIDPGGLVHVGPQSAGAFPGPACYSRGGEDATVTDAAVVQGYLNPQYFLGGRMRVDPLKAERAIQEKIANPLGVGLQEAAFTVISIVNINMVSAITEMTVNQGVDPRDLLLVAGGGAAGSIILPCAKELGIKKILMPKAAGAFSAMGGLASDIVRKFGATYITDSKNFDYESVNKILKELEQQGEAFLSSMKLPSESRRLEYFVEARYPGQVWELETPLRSNRITPESLPQIVNDFHDVHERVFAIKEPGQYIECVYWKVQATGIMPKLRMKEQSYGGEDPSAALKDSRKAYFKEMGGLVETPIYDGEKLEYGHRVSGPAIIEEPTTTIVIIPGSDLTVTKWGNYFIELQ